MTLASLPGESACGAALIKSRHGQKFLTILATLELKSAAIAQASNRPTVTTGKGGIGQWKTLAISTPQRDTCQT